jgi:uncharacterized protein (TIGR02145 family)
MAENSEKNTSLIPIGSNGVIRVGKSIEITNKIISEHEDRLLQEIFPTVKIGNQEWMTKNLDVDCYANGAPIPQVQNPKDWTNLKTGAWCYYDNDSENGKIFGKLYNWYAVNDPRGLAPKGWRIPSDDDWTIFIDCLGGINIAGTKMKSTNGWKSNGNGTNESGFSGLPGGGRSYYNYGTFYFIGSNGSWWSSAEDDSTRAWSHNLNFRNGCVVRASNLKGNGLSIRCLKD